MTKLAEVLSRELLRLASQQPAEAAELAATALLYAYACARTSDERERVALEISRLDSGGARLELAELAEQGLAEIRQEVE